MQNNENNRANMRFVVIFALVVWLLAATLFYYLVGYGVAISIVLGLLAGIIAAILLHLGVGREGADVAPAAGQSAAPAPAAAAAPQEAPKAAPAKTASVKTTPAKAAAAKPAKAKPAPAKAKTAATPARKPVAADGKPELLSGPRAGGADDLKMIKGVGPKLEQRLHEMGIFHFDQVASWRKKEVEWVDNNIEGFKGRVSRDDWVKQAKVLAKGGSTEFSARVKKGGVY